MKKLFFAFGLAVLASSFTSCVCNCYTQPNTSNTVCKEDYEQAFGSGTWASEGAASYRNAGWNCQN